MTTSPILEGLSEGPPTHSSGARTGARLPVVGILLVALFSFLGLSVPAGVAHADTAYYAVYHATDDISARLTPTGAPTNLIGIYRGQGFGVQCQTIGEPVGPGNTLYFQTTWNVPGRGPTTIYVPDTFTDSPHLAGQPALPGIPMCNGSVTASAPSNIINGHSLGAAQNSRHGWGRCTVQDFKGGEFDWTIVSYTAGTHIVHSGMLWGWFDNGGAPDRLGCPTSDEYSWNTGVRQDFQGGSLFWHSGMNHAVLTAPASLSAINWAAGRLGQNVYAGWCLQFVYDAYLQAGVNIGGAGSADKWARTHSLNTSTTPPPGALVFWYGSPGDHYDGHVALSVGGGYTISTEELTTLTVHVMSIAARNNAGKPYAGWIMP